MFLVSFALHKEMLKIMDSPVKVAEKLPVTVDLREFGLISKPLDIGFMNCGSAAVAAASIAETSILYDIKYYKKHPRLDHITTDNMSVSTKYFLYTSTVYSEDKGYYCTQQPEFMLNDVLKLDSVQFSFKNNENMAYNDRNTQFNPDVLAVGSKKDEITIDDDFIDEPEQFVDPFYKDEDGNGIIILYHTPYFALDGDQPFGQDVVDLMKTYLAYGFTLMAQVHIDSDSTYQTFKNWNSGEVFSAQCKRVHGKYTNINIDKMKSKIVSDGFNRIQERIINVVIVGYGKKQGQDVWVVKFPFGPAFGNLGYMYFPILNDTLCMEQYIVTVLPKHWKEGMQQGFFSESRGTTSGLQQIYSIIGLISSMKSQSGGDLAGATAIDQYSNRKQMSVNGDPNEKLLVVVPPITNEWQIVNPSILTSSPLSCNFSGFKGGFKGKLFKPEELFNCYTTLRIVFNATQSSVQQPYKVSCTPQLPIKLICDSASCEQMQIKQVINNADSDLDELNWICYSIQHTSSVTEDGVNRMMIQMLEMPIIVKATGGSTIKCLQSQDVVQCTTQSPDYEKLKKFTTLPNPADGILLNNLIPYEAICEGANLNINCTRIVYDSESKINETWNCKPPKPFPSGSQEFRHKCTGDRCNFTLICKGPDRDFTSEETPKARTKMYSEIRQFATNCFKNGDYYVCPPNYLMNSTIQRLRQNYSNQVSLKDTDGSYKMFDANFSALFYDFDFIQILNTRNDNYTFNFKNARSQVNFSSKIYFHYSHIARPVNRTLNMDCFFNLSGVKTDEVNPDKKVVDPKQYNCRLWNEDSGHDYTNQAQGEVYICNYTTVTCQAPIFGYSTNLLLNYSLVSTASIPLIFKKYQEDYTDGGVNKKRNRYELFYNAIQWDTSVVKVSGNDPNSFSFNPCSLPSSDGIYSEYCQDVTLQDLNMTCDGSLCVPDTSVEFQFNKVTTHENTTIKTKVLPKIQSNSKFYCKFVEQLQCFIDRLDPNNQKLSCNKGKLDCQGATQTTFFQYSIEGVVAKQETGTSVFTIVTTDFDCQLVTIKDFRNTDGDFQVDLKCNIRNSQEHFSMASNSPDYLVRNANSIDDVAGMIQLEGMNRSFQLIFSIGLIAIVLFILIISTVFALWPGEIKGGYAKMANKCCCCDRCRFRCVDYDRFGVPMIGDDELDAEFANVDIKKVANAFKSGFGGLNYDNLSRALKRQEEKLATGKIKMGVEKKELKQKLKEQEEAERKLAQGDEKKSKLRKPVKKAIVMNDIEENDVQIEDLGVTDAGRVLQTDLAVKTAVPGSDSKSASKISSAQCGRPSENLKGFEDDV